MFKVRVDILDLIYTFSIVSCSIYQMVILAGKRFNADVFCCLKDANRIDLNFKYGPMSLQMFTTHCVLSW